MDNYALVNDIASVWKYADEMFPAFGSISVDWDGAFGAFLPRALAAKDEKEAQLLLCEFLNLLEDGHTDYTPPKAFRDGIGYLPFEPDYAGGKWHIGGANEALSTHIGAEIRSINGKSMDGIAASRAFARTGEGKLEMRLYSGNILYVKWDDCLYDKAADEIRAASRAFPGGRGARHAREHRRHDHVRRKSGGAVHRRRISRKSKAHAPDQGHRPCLRKPACWHMFA